MEIRVFFKCSDIEKALRERHGEQIQIRWDYGSYCRIYPTDGGKEIKAYHMFCEASGATLAYVRLANLVEELPELVSGLEEQKVSLHDTLAAEHNSHITQDFGSHGTTKFQVSFDVVSSFVQDGSHTHHISYEVYRAVIEIRLRGSSRQSVEACYNKIRRGELGSGWKGECVPPVIVGRIEELEL